MNYYLVTLRLILGAIEKTARHLVIADNEHRAGIKALTGECHDKPDFDEYPCKTACWDMGENIYQIETAEIVSEAEYKILNKFIGVW